MSEDGVLTWVNGRNAGASVGIQTKKDGHQNCFLSVYIPENKILFHTHNFKSNKLNSQHTVATKKSKFESNVLKNPGSSEFIVILSP